ncbi:endonuclease/exonuclease/phosphatase family metal-dependent hydrolase [Herbaspirillum sp. Sphag1AN]|uniref:endonuclease/exonuclease/phosphatase family protein n=1 Tax=unclassified Herbaspirillum TaxID=2624150 RepID=UPI0016219B36|nr:MULTISPECIES: endonuclease/exonuclease/phosphatase family protein [unclassified Herbaspirillum]MBB3214828.1 endonuclease/exonuclease/phosphatase family metal-dependent hydrolase [Herbaspirillum sp. Sphag1AN]MBB3248022.1 endonuclease/exonuclease/phosphatase family metal-dependent hydrolase [Herbaspirillum sp. Sphag64]
MQLRIATYNIHKGVTSLTGRPRIHALKQALTKLDADILFLQEVQGRHDRNAVRHTTSWPQLGQHEYLAEGSHHVAYGMNAVYDHGHHGNALLSRFPIAASRNQDVSDHAYESRGILHCVLDIEGTAVHCYVIHLGLFAGGRRRQTAALIEAVLASAGTNAPIIIAGDFNDWSNQLSDMLRERLGVKEVFDQQVKTTGLIGYLRQLSGLSTAHQPQPARTFPAAMPVLQLDRIYLRGFEVETAQVLRGGLWATLSDHAPIITTLHLT